MGLLFQKMMCRPIASLHANPADCASVVAADVGANWAVHPASEGVGLRQANAAPPKQQVSGAAALMAPNMSCFVLPSLIEGAGDCCSRSPEPTFAIRTRSSCKYTWQSQLVITSWACCACATSASHAVQQLPQLLGHTEPAASHTAVLRDSEFERSFTADAPQGLHTAAVSDIATCMLQPNRCARDIMSRSEVLQF